MVATQASADNRTAFQQQFENRKPHLPGDAEVRERAMQQLLTTGLPDRKTERWRYTRINSLLKQPLEPAQKPVTTTATERQPLLDELNSGSGAPVLVFQQGYFCAELSRLEGLGEIQFKPLAAALESGAVMLPEAADGRDRAFDQLNTALVADGGWLQLPAGKHPLITIVVLSGSAAETSYWRLLVTAASHCEAELAIVYADSEADQETDVKAYQLNSSIDLDLAPNAQVSLSQLQQQGEQAFQVSSLRANLQRDSSFKSHVLTLGGAISRDDVDINLAEAGAHVEFDGLQLTNGRQHADLHLTLEHAAPNCTSQVSHHGLFGDHGRGVFNGRVHVHPGADGTDSQMSSKNLLLSDRAEIDAKPELEIYADDVKCAHGCTVGDLNRDELFYLRSRGLTEQDARALLLSAFAAASFATLGGHWGEHVANAVTKKMEQLSHE